MKLKIILIYYTTIPRFVKRQLRTSANFGKLHNILWCIPQKADKKTLHPGQDTAF